jgi:cell division protein FtsQ
VVVGLAALAALAGASLAIAHSPLFSARHIRIVGTTHGEDRAILSVSGLGAHPPLVDIDPRAAAQAIERLSWVDTAQVAVSFPSSVSVTVTERLPVAYVPSSHGGALVDATGRVLADVGREPAGVVTVDTGVAVPRAGRWFAPSVRGLFAVAAEVPTTLVGRIVAITRTGRDGIVAELAHEPLVIFGPQTDAHAKFVALATVLADVSVAGISAIDLRAPSNPVLTP